VVGVFNALPLISNIEIFPTIIIDNATISDALVSEPVAIAVYPLLKSTTPNAINSTNFQQILSEYDPTATITAITMNDYTDGMIGTSQIISQFLLIEIVFLLVLVVFGIGIVLYIGVQEKSHDLGILRARGVDKWVVYKMQVAEGGILIGIGMLLSFLGILAAYTNLIQFNTTFTIEFSLVPQFLIPWSGLLWLLGVSSVVMITNILIAVKTEMHNSEISHIAALLRV
jgi:ABC-type antimicrobial peptide transport system permease subunit